MSLSSSDAFSPIELSTPDGARASITPHGAHVISWITPDGIERLFLSARTERAPGCAIRGGVPVVFPQFSNRGPLRPHGFVRNMTWRRTGTTPTGGTPPTATARFELTDTPESRQQWDHAFVAAVVVTVGGTQLEVALEVTNTDSQPFEFMAALHTYFAVRESAAVTVEGLRGVAFWNREPVIEGVQQDELLTIGDELDRVFWAVPGPLVMRDGERRLEIAQAGFGDAVIWNPGAERCAGLKDMEPDGWRRMLCIEAAQIAEPVRLAPGDSWRGAQRVTAQT